MEEEGRSSSSSRSSSSIKAPNEKYTTVQEKMPTRGIFQDNEPGKCYN